MLLLASAKAFKLSQRHPDSMELNVQQLVKSVYLLAKGLIAQYTSPSRMTLAGVWIKIAIPMLAALQLGADITVGTRPSNVTTT